MIVVKILLGLAMICNAIAMWLLLNNIKRR